MSGGRGKSWRRNEETCEDKKKRKDSEKKQTWRGLEKMLTWRHLKTNLTAWLKTIELGTELHGGRGPPCWTVVDPWWAQKGTEMARRSLRERGYFFGPGATNVFLTAHNRNPAHTTLRQFSTTNSFYNPLLRQLFPPPAPSLPP